MTPGEKSLKLCKEAGGKIEVVSKVAVKNKEDLAVAYTPGVAQPCLEIQKDPSKMYDYTCKKNTIAVVTNGSAVLGLGNIGAGAGMPVMEGKAIIFKTFAGVDAFPICLDTQDPDKIIEAVKLMEPTFGGINLEDIKAPECFYIENKLKEICNIPVFHDDQHGTAIIVVAAALNAFKLVGKDISTAKVAVNGAGAAALSTVKLLMLAGFKNISMCDIDGVIYEGRPGMHEGLVEIAKVTNRDKVQGTIKDIIAGADMLIGLSAPNCITKEMISTMNKDAIVFVMANPVPEIMPEDAKAGGARIIGTGRSDFPNQVNNSLVFPGLFRGALDVQASKITDEMKVAAAKGLAALIPDEELRDDYVIPDMFDPRVAPSVAKYVAEIALKSGIAGRTDITPEQVAQHTRELVGNK